MFSDIDLKKTVSNNPSVLPLFISKKTKDLTTDLNISIFVVIVDKT